MPSSLIKQLELSLLTPEVRKSPERVNELLADDFLEFGMFGKKYTKQEMIESMSNSEIERYEKYEAVDFEAKEIAPDTTMLTYKASIENTKTGTKIWTLRCSIWQKRGDDWQMIFHQGTPVI